MATYVPKLKVGQLVRVYQKPRTLEEFEGYARCTEFFRADDYGCEMWYVHFCDPKTLKTIPDESPGLRWINLTGYKP